MVTFIELTGSSMVPTWAAVGECRDMKKAEIWNTGGKRAAVTQCRSSLSWRAVLKPTGKEGKVVSVMGELMAAVVSTALNTDSVQSNSCGHTRWFIA